MQSLLLSDLKIAGHFCRTQHSGFFNWEFFGIPVEPEVCTSTVSESENHSSKSFQLFHQSHFEVLGSPH